MSGPASDIETVKDMGKSHPDNLRWRCYYAAFQRKHGRKSTGDEFDAPLMGVVDVCFAVLKTDLWELFG
jgi:hypothetical protein